nr:hypothetical protein [Tanacetum cinerariifolium]
MGFQIMRGNVFHPLTLKKFRNMRRIEKGSAMPIDPHHIPTILQSSSSQPQMTHKPRKPIRKVTEVPQPSEPMKHVVDKAVYKELDDRLVRLATTASSLKAKHDSESSYTEESLSENASKQGRMIDDIDADEDMTLVNVQVDAEMFDVDTDLGGEELFVEQEVFADKEKIDEVTLAQALAELKTSKPKAKRDKEKGIMVEELVKHKKKGQIRLDEEASLKLQAELHAEFDEEQRLAREKAKTELEANIALIEI